MNVFSKILQPRKDFRVPKYLPKAIRTCLRLLRSLRNDMSKKSQPQVICWQAAYSSEVLVSGQRIIRSCRQRKLPQKISRGYETTEKIFNERLSS